MKLIVGLGNPGRRYAGTRHNVGWRVATAIADRAALGPWKEKFESCLVEGRWHGERIALARPLTYMNHSGRAVRRMMDFWKLPEGNLLVAVDDMALPLGRIRLRASGSAGGHNGLASIIAALGHERFARVRVGIGPPPPAPEVHSDFVLSPFPEGERARIDEAVGRAADAAETWITDGLQAAMTRFNQSTDTGQEEEEAHRPTNHANT